MPEPASLESSTTVESHVPARGNGDRRRASASLPDRLPPHSIEAEQGVLGCILLAPNDSLGECIPKFRKSDKLYDGNKTQDKWQDRAKDQAQDSNIFYDLRHQAIYDVLVKMYDAKEPIDLLTVYQRLKDLRLIESVGGAAYVASLPEKVPSAANLSYYTDIVWDKYLLRKMISACSGVVSEIYNFEGEVDRLLDEVETRILRISEERVEQESNDIKALVHRAIDQIERYHQQGGQLDGVSTGFQDFDKMSNGLKGGEMIVIAARPSMGKTSLAMNVAEHVALDLKLPVGVFSLEMTASSLVMRLLCSRSRVNLRKIQGGFISEHDFARMTKAAGELSSAPLFIDDTSGLSVLQLRAKARRMSQQHEIKLFVIDYLQLLHSTALRARDNRQQEIADISNGIKSLAKELKVPVIVLSQLNRELEKEKGRKPRMSDLRESGAIEQDADLIGLLYAPSTGDEEEGEPVQDSDARAVNLLIAKQRNGPTGDVHLIFRRGITRFESASKISSEDAAAGAQ